MLHAKKPGFGLVSNVRRRARAVREAKTIFSINFFLLSGGDGRKINDLSLATYHVYR